MKKSTLLSLLTAGAVIATSAGTYAVWDSLTADTEHKTVTLGQAVDVQATAGTFALNPASRTTFSTEAGQAASGDITVLLDTVDAALQTGRKVELTPTITFKDGGTDMSVDASQYSVVVKKGDTELTGVSGVYTDDGTTTALDFTSTGNKYTVVITPKDTSLAGKTVDVTVHVELK